MRRTILCAQHATCRFTLRIQVFCLSKRNNIIVKVAISMLEREFNKCVKTWCKIYSGVLGQNVCRASDAIRSGTRYAKWAGGSRSQKHRRAAKGGFTQDDGYVRGLAPTHDCSSFGSLLHELSLAVLATIIQSSIPIPVPGQYRLSLCLE